jgi:prolipoprotein diacylglyceryltransferase
MMGEMDPLGRVHILTASIPPPSRWFHAGPLQIHYYALFIVLGVVAGVWLT